MVEVVVARLGLDSSSDSFVVILRERQGTRVLPIWIGRPEAESIAMELNHVPRERPMTHDVCATMLRALGGALERVVVTRMQQRTFFAELHLQSATGPHIIDARPSDSIAMALRCQAPVFVAETLLAEPDAASDEPPATSQMTAEQLQAYLANLRPEDFGKFMP